MGESAYLLNRSSSDGAHSGRNDEADHRSASTVEERHSSDRCSVTSISSERVGRTHVRRRGS